jgi:hypothetical protein
MIIPEGVAGWALVAFALWLTMTFVFGLLRLKGAPVAAAILSWLVARVVLSVLPTLLDWLRGHPYG